ncbi:MAG: hypothetical protein DVB25_09250 [Verrucomicrobia bacterium]|nr:MAG: hypothetical protein DVB25_09250 [Verrucomicrobiota bacterium]
MTNNINIYKPPHSRRLTKEERFEVSENFLPVGALLLAGGGLIAAGLEMAAPAWVNMWLLCVGLFLLAKAAVLPTADRLAFVFLWPGLDAAAFLRKPTEAMPLMRRGTVNLIIGTVTIWGMAHTVADPFVATWVAMVGFIFALHCGVFTLLAAGWRNQGRDVKPLMSATVLTGSVTEFWGKRWNHAFRDVAHTLLFKPVTRRFGAMAGMWAVFLASGLAHEVVVSVPAGAGYGGPTVYFALQALGMSLERGCPIKPGLFWRLRALVFLLLPLPLLFHTPFVMNVCHPFFNAIGALP